MTGCNLMSGPLPVTGVAPQHGLVPGGDSGDERQGSTAIWVVSQSSVTRAAVGNSSAAYSQSLKFLACGLVLEIVMLKPCLPFHSNCSNCTHALLHRSHGNPIRSPSAAILKNRDFAGAFLALEESKGTRTCTPYLHLDRLIRCLLVFFF